MAIFEINEKASEPLVVDRLVLNASESWGVHVVVLRFENQAGRWIFNNSKRWILERNVAEFIIESAKEKHKENLLAGWIFENKDFPKRLIRLPKRLRRWYLADCLGDVFNQAGDGDYERFCALLDLPALQRCANKKGGELWAA